MSEKLSSAVVYTTIALLGVGLVILFWIATARAEQRDRELCAKLCAPADSIYSSRRGCFCEGSDCRRF